MSIEESFSGPPSPHTNSHSNIAHRDYEGELRVLSRQCDEALDQRDRALAEVERTNSNALLLLQEQSVLTDLIEELNEKLAHANRTIPATAIRKVLDGFDQSVFIRNTVLDQDPMWAIKFLPFLQALAELTNYTD